MKYLILLFMTASLILSCNSETSKKEVLVSISTKDTINQDAVQNKPTIRRKLYFDSTANGQIFYYVRNGIPQISIRASQETQFDKVYSLVDSLLKNNTLKIYPDSSLRIQIAFYNRFTDLADEVHQMPSLQAYLKKAKEEKQRFLDHKIIAKEIIKSNRFQKLLQLLQKDKSNIKHASCDKCHSRLSKTDSTQYSLHCLYLFITLD